MKPDRKEPARAPALSAGERNRSPSQTPLQGADWYVIADEGELTLRISNGLRVGEDRWGELTLNHPLSAHRWLEFTIDEDGELWCRSSRKDIAIRCNDEILDSVLLDAGVPIHLPHNLLHISNHIRRGDSADWELNVGLLDEDEGQLLEPFDELVDTQADVPPIPEPQPATSQADGRLAGSTEQAPANDSLETFIPTLETVVVSPRTIASEKAGPAIERAVAKLKNRTANFGETPTSAADSTESALVPVDADGPFHTEEIRAALQQPIQVAEPAQAAGPNRGAHHNDPIYSPSVTTSVVGSISGPQLRLILGVAVAVLLVLGVALFAAITAAPDSSSQRSLGAGKGSASTSPVVPAAPATEPNQDFTQPLATTSEARTKSLLQTASALLSSPAELQPDTLDFAIRSLNLVLAAQPENAEAQQLLTSAEQIRLQQTQGSSPRQGAQSNNPNAQTTASSPSVSNGGGASTPTSLGNRDPRLAKAAELIALGAILAPRDSSAVSLIMSVLAEDPTSADAIRLLNRSASVLVAQADEEYETLGVYAARNTLEEVLSFHPKHGPANQRWRNWMNTSAPSYAAPQPAASEPSLDPNPEANLEGRL